MSTEPRYVWAVVYSQHSDDTTDLPYKDPLCIAKYSYLLFDDLGVELEEGWLLDTVAAKRASFTTPPKAPESLKFFVPYLQDFDPVTQEEAPHHAWLCGYADDIEDAGHLMQREIEKKDKVYGMPWDETAWQLVKDDGVVVGATCHSHETRTRLQYRICKVLVHTRGDVYEGEK